MAPAAQPLLYTKLAEWFHLLTRPEDYATEAEMYREALGAVLPPVDAPARSSVLELGAGGGNTASHLKQHFDMVLTDLSPDMIAISQQLNPDLPHIQGDMRTLRLGRRFDAVFLHDAVMYLTTEADLRAAVETAFVHTVPGGALLIVPDCTRETFRQRTHCGGHDGEDVTPPQPGRSLRYLEWITDPDPDDTEYEVDFAYLLRHADGTVETYGDHHTFGLFPRSTWLRVLGEGGFRVVTLPFDHPEVEGVTDMFLGVRER